MSSENLSTLLVSVALTVGLTLLGLALVQFLAGRVVTIASQLDHLREFRRAQTLTLIRILQWVVQILIAVSGLLMLLSTLGVDITPLLASAGVAGLAVTLGAQTLIKDLIGGVLVLVENQYVVGDAIQVGDVTGSVEQLTLRTTHVRDLNGYLHIIPNGEVRIIANLSRDWSRAMVDVGVAYEEDLDRVMGLLETLAEAFARDEEFQSRLLETPQVLGPLSLGDWAINVRMMVKTPPGEQWAVGRELRKRVNATFIREGIVSPYPRQELFVRQVDPDAGHQDASSGKDSE
jgi:small-conductance mechanosensitive channel